MIAIQFGQCGNQLGHTLFSKISANIDCTDTGVPYKLNYEYCEETFNKWFTNISKDGKRLARAILVDSEQKVISKICKETAMPWAYCARNIVCQAGGGCANNWAYGYNTKGDELCDIILNLVREEVDKMDHFDGFILLMSSGGGTGSGIGCKITNILREEYRTKLLINVVVLPFSFGEVCTQNYNTMLTLAKLYDKSDMILLFENEQVHNMCTSLLNKSAADLKDINEVISEKLLGVLQPVNDLNYNLNYIVSQIVSHPLYKFATIKSTPHASSISLEYEPVRSWQSHIYHLKEMLRIPSSNFELPSAEHRKPPSFLSDTSHHVYTCSVSNILITHGMINELDTIETTELNKKALYANWNTNNGFSHFHQTRKLFGLNKFAALITNNAQVSHPLNTLLDKTWNSYIHSAYLHQYLQFGLEEDDFLKAFGILENSLNEYNTLVSNAKS